MLFLKKIQKYAYLLKKKKHVSTRNPFINISTPKTMAGNHFVKLEIYFFF